MAAEKYKKKKKKWWQYFFFSIFECLFTQNLTSQGSQLFNLLTDSSRSYMETIRKSKTKRL